MNEILSNPVISEFLSGYPKEKHTTCILGICLLGIHNLKTFSINFEEILNQIESKKLLNTEKLPRKKQNSRVSTSTKSFKAEDTPRFVQNEFKAEQRSLSFQRLQAKPSTFLKKQRKVNQKIFKTEQKAIAHCKTPSIVNPEIVSDYHSIENSEVLRIADQFLNGRFAVEYCGMDKNPEKNATKFEFSTKAEDPNPLKDSSHASSSSSFNSRRNSFSVVSSGRLTRGDRNSSYSKFW